MMMKNVMRSMPVLKKKLDVLKGQPAAPAPTNGVMRSMPVLNPPAPRIAPNPGISAPPPVKAPVGLVRSMPMLKKPAVMPQPGAADVTPSGPSLLKNVLKKRIVKSTPAYPAPARMA